MKNVTIFGFYSLRVGIEAKIYRNDTTVMPAPPLSRGAS